MPPRILLTGVRWFGDLVPYCERALAQLGVAQRTVTVNEHAWSTAADRRRRWLARLPLIGRALDWRLFRRDRNRAAREIGDAFLASVREFAPDVVILLAGWGDPLPSDAVSSSGARCFIWLMDDPFLHDGSLLDLAQAAERVYVVDEGWADPLRLLTGRPVAALPCGADPTVHRVESSDRVATDRAGRIAFVGSSYAGYAAGRIRESLLAPLAPLGLRIYGDKGWLSAEAPLRAAYRGGEISTEEANLVYNSAEIVVNINHPQFRASTGLRTFAIAAAGAFQLLDWRPGLERYFDLENELITYRSPMELREKAVYYLSHAEERIRIASNAHRRVLAEHTYVHRLERMLDDAGLSRPPEAS